MRLAGTFSTMVFGCILVLSFVLILAPLNRQASAAEIQSRSLELNNSTNGAIGVTYTTSFNVATAGAIGSISLEFCSNSPLLTDPCTAPSGMDDSNAQLTAQSGVTGFSISPGSTANEIILTRPSVVAPTGPVSYTFSNITNPDSTGSFYARISTYASSNASGPSTDAGGLALALNSAVNVSAYVPPYLLFCSANTITDLNCATSNGDYLDLGNFSSSSTSSGTTQLLASTNAQSGYNVSVQGPSLESGNNVLPALTSPTPAQPGVAQFGINLRANNNPRVGADPTGPGSGIATMGYDTPNLFEYKSGDVIADSPVPDTYREYTLSYIVNINHSQPVGIYASTFTYIALANF